VRGCGVVPNSSGGGGSSKADSSSSVSAPLNLSKPKKEDNNNQVAPPPLRLPCDGKKRHDDGLSPAFSSAEEASAAAAAMQFFHKTKSLLNSGTFGLGPLQVDALQQSQQQPLPQPPPLMQHAPFQPRQQQQLPDVVSTLPMFPSPTGMKSLGLPHHHRMPPFFGSGLPLEFSLRNFMLDPADARPVFPSFGAVSAAMAAASNPRAHKKASDAAARAAAEANQAATDEEAAASGQGKWREEGETFQGSEL
jgi:hypothetical protein